MNETKMMTGTFRWINAWGEDAGSGRAEATLVDGRFTMTLYHGGYVYGVTVEKHTNIGTWQCVEEDRACNFFCVRVQGTSFAGQVVCGGRRPSNTMAKWFNAAFQPTIGIVHFFDAS